MYEKIRLTIMILSGRYLYIVVSYKEPVYKESTLGNKIHKQRLGPNILAVSNYTKFLKL